MARSVEEKAAAALIDAVDSMSFNSRLFAGLILDADPNVQHRIMAAFMACIEFWNLDFEREWHVPGNTAACQAANKIVTALKESPSLYPFH